MRVYKRGDPTRYYTTTKNECHKVMPLSCGVYVYTSSSEAITTDTVAVCCAVIYSLQLQYITKYADSSVDLYLTSQYLHTLT